jgi:hypothetical protein
VGPEAEKLSKQFSNCGLPSLLFWPATGFDGRKYFLAAPETVKKISFSGQECLQDCIKKKLIFWVEILAFLGNFCYIYLIIGICPKILFLQPSHYIKIPYQRRQSQQKNVKFCDFF